MVVAVVACFALVEALARLWLWHLSGPEAFKRYASVSSPAYADNFSRMLSGMGRVVLFL